MRGAQALPKKEVAATSQTILVALDGSERAEAALPYAVVVARALNASLELLSVIVPETASLHSTAFGRAAREAVAREGALHAAMQRYLETLAQTLRDDGTPTTVTIVIGEAAAEILRAAASPEKVMVVLATRGHSGVRRFLFGSVTDDVVLASTQPVLVVTPSEPSTPVGELPRWQRLFVPLDGSPRAEQALPLAQQLAQALGATLRLVRVAPWLSTPIVDYPRAGEIAAANEQVRLEAQAALAQVRGRLPASLPVEIVVLRGEAAEQLLDDARTSASDLIVMTGAQRGGLRRSLFGSIVDHLIRAEVPVLFVPPEPHPEKMVG